MTTVVLIDEVKVLIFKLKLTFLHQLFFIPILVYQKMVDRCLVQILGEMMKQCEFFKLTILTHFIRYPCLESNQ